MPGTAVEQIARRTGARAGPRRRRPLRGRSTSSSARWRRPMARTLLSPDLRELASAPDHCRYLGVVCLLLRDAAERQPVLPPEHHRPPRPADDRRRDDARRRPRARRRPPHLRLEVRRPVSSPLHDAAGRGDRAASSSATRGRSSPTCATTRSSARSSSARGSPSRCISLGGAKNACPSMFPVAGARARVDGARLPGDRQRPGRHRRRRTRRAGDPRPAQLERREGVHDEEATMKMVGVTGAAGFIGVAPLRAPARRRATRSSAVDDLSYGSVGNIARLPRDPRFRFEVWTARASATLRRAFDGCDAIVHLAAKKIPRFGGTLRDAGGERRRG